MRMPMSTPEASATYGRLSTPRSLMNFERVIGLMTLYDAIARNEYANIINAVVPSPSRTSATGFSSFSLMAMGPLGGRAEHPRRAPARDRGLRGTAYDMRNLK